MYKIDLNCDLGESFGCWKMGNDEQILPYISSVNIACGFHAGDPSIIHKTVKNAIQHNLAIGAHPGFPDLVGFGRRNMAVSAEDVYDLIVYQIGALQAFLNIYQQKLHHVKPHGALYNMAAVDAKLASAIVHAVQDSLGNEVFLYGLANSELIQQAENNGLPAIAEVFADRTYTQAGTLTPRSQKNALITDENKAIEQILQIILHQQVTTVDSSCIAMPAQTVCIHGDGAEAVPIAKKIKQVLKEHDIVIAAPTL